MMTSELFTRLNEAIASLSVGVFAATVDSKQSCLTLHVRAGGNMAYASSQAREALRLAGAEIDVRVLSHTLRSVASPRSIEQWLKVFASGSVIFDPTLVAQRAQSLLDAAKACRREFGKLVTGVYFHPDQRVMYVVMPSATDAAGALDHQQRLLGLIGAGAARLPFAVRVTSKVPRGNLTPVDAASAPLFGRLMRFIRRGTVPGAIALAVSSLALPAAANTPQPGRTSFDAAVAAKSSANDRYGVLWSLSVFSDGQSLSANGAFAAKGLENFFGDSQLSDNPIVRLAQTRRPRTIIRDTDTDSGGPGPGGASS